MYWGMGRGLLWAPEPLLSMNLDGIEVTNMDLGVFQRWGSPALVGVVNINAIGPDGSNSFCHPVDTALSLSFWFPHSPCFMWCNFIILLSYYFTSWTNIPCFSILLISWNIGFLNNTFLLLIANKNCRLLREYDVYPDSMKIIGVHFV